MGPEAYRFVDFLVKARQKYWQILPLNPTDASMGHSPYSSFSAFGFNTLLISPDLLLNDGWLREEDLEEARSGNNNDVDYVHAQRIKRGLLCRAWRNYSAGPRLAAFERFCADHSYWLDDFSLFVVLKEHFGQAPWSAWPQDFQDRHTDDVTRFAAGHKEDLEREKFFQFLFCDQWKRLHDYSLKQGVGIIGDIPIYVNYDSVDVWVNPDIFKLDADKRQTVVAGVPPDYFSEDGQRWGNPLFNWDRLLDTSFGWWVERVRHNLTLFDKVRIDHFRAFVQCWEIPAEETTARGGAWADVPGRALFDVLQAKVPRLEVIAEDLGIITPEVDALKERFRFPGMCVVLFAFHNDYKKSRDLPENHKPLSVVYTGTHDNNTVQGWYKEDITRIEKDNMREYFGKDIPVDDIHWVMIEMALRSPAYWSIIPLGDLLGLGSEARINRPSTAQGNWKWRFRSECLLPGIVEKLRRLTISTER
jgi:4-alpha-glucanotransferase